jgi:dihydroorotate dehydrogenase (NAD+) catalytic subunit
MLYKPYYNPEKTYEENFKKGPYGAFADKKVYKDKKEPQYKFFGFPVHFPFGIPAGPLLNGKFVKAALDKGFDIVTYKTVRSKQYPCSEWPNVLGVQVKGNLTLDLAEKGVIGTHTYREPLAITNSLGVPSFNPDFWQKDLKNSVKYSKRGQLVIGSFQGTTNPQSNIITYIQDFVNLARMVKKTGVKVLEINLSCPNEGTGHLLCFDIERTKIIVEKVKNEIGNTPLIIKIAYFPEQKQLKKLINCVGRTVDGIAAINTIPAKIFDKNGNQALPGKNRLKSGVCGAPIKWAGLEMVKRLKKLKEKHSLPFTIIGVGGITNINDYNKYVKNGAEVVMSATGSMWNPYLAQEIKKSL